ncbi:3-phosphoglycerate kinase, partial [Tanacetum coccineum]
ELDYLDGAVSNTKRPFAAIVGDSKVSSKIGVIESLLEKCDILLSSGDMIFTFYKAQDLSVGSSLVEEDKLDRATTLLAKAKGIVIKDINKVLKNFIWSQGELSKGKAKIALLNICRHKTKGGLGLKDLDVWNKCRSIWAIDEESNDSWGWNNILNIRKEVRQFIVMKIGNGEKVSVIYDNWCGVGILQSFITNRDLCNVRGNAERI